MNIKDKFFSFFEQNGYLNVQPAPLLQENPLFNIAGMIQFKDYFLGKKKVPYDYMITSQPCLRIHGKQDDINNIGKTNRHLTNFTMLGNFVFGKITKKEAIFIVYDFLLSLGLDKKYLYFTYHDEDIETQSILKDYNSINLSNNIWESGLNGPWGYCCEIFYCDQENALELIKNNDDLALEIWNVVFMEFIGTEKLSQMFIDTGGGLERLESVINKDFDIFHTPSVSKYMQMPFNLSLEKKRIIADHTKTLHVLFDEKCYPGPKNHGYVVRKILRKIFIILHKEHKSTVMNYLNQFLNQSVSDEWDQFQIIINQCFKDNNPKVLHDTYGIPWEILENHFSIIHKKIKKLPNIYEENSTQGKIIQYFNSNWEENKQDSRMFIIFDKINFYPELNKIMGNIGKIYNNNCELQVIKTMKEHNSIILKCDVIGEVKLEDVFYFKLDEIHAQRRNKFIKLTNELFNGKVKYIKSEGFGLDLNENNINILKKYDIKYNIQNNLIQCYI